MSAIRVAKRDLRKKIQNILRDVKAFSVDQQSGTITAKLLELPEYRNAKRISVYMSMPHGEVSTRNIVQDALSKGKQVFIPYIHFMRTAPSGKAVSGMDMLSLNSMLDFESLQPDGWGIPSLSDDTVPTRRNCFGGFGISATDSYPSDNEWGLDLIVMPGVAFDSGFNRLGHGKGYYDNFLSRYAKRATSDPSKRLTNPLLVALALKEQVLSEPDTIPMEEHDWLMDRIIVGDGESMIRCR